MSLLTASLFIMTAATVIAAIVDVRCRRIPNAIVASIVVAAFVVHAVNGWLSILDALTAMLVVFLVGSFAFARGMIGGGDVKLVSACTAVVGLGQTLSLLAAIFLCGGVLVVVEAARRRRLRALMIRTAGVVSGLASTTGVRVPYGVAIAAGAAVYSASHLIPMH